MSVGKADDSNGSAINSENKSSGVTNPGASYGDDVILVGPTFFFNDRVSLSDTSQSTGVQAELEVGLLVVPEILDEPSDLSDTFFTLCLGLLFFQSSF